MDKIICLVGESGSGKSTIAELLEMEGYNYIQSYTTRKPRFEGEKGHIFLDRSDEKVEDIIINSTLNNKNEMVLCGYKPWVIAYTFYDGNYYWATKGQYQGKGISVYVIDPAGVEYLEEKVPDAEILIIYLKADRKTRLARMLSQRDPNEAFDRARHDREIFKNIQCDFVVDANRKIEEVMEDIKEIIRKR